MYHCGLRVGETVRIQLADIHGRENPPRLHIRNGKGGKDRFPRSSERSPEKSGDRSGWWMCNGGQR